MKVGVLALQGAYDAHLQALGRLSVETRLVRRPKQLEGLAGLIIPGGESTVMGKLMADIGLIPAIQEHFQAGMGVYGTCAGMIAMASTIVGYEQQPRLSLMDTAVRRNAFGSLSESSEMELSIPTVCDSPLRAVMIKGPFIEWRGPAVEVLAEHDGRIVLARQGRALAASFHTELTGDDRLHAYFLRLCQGEA
jgi:5'-phosphate synthase pdxT subunit